LVLASAKFLFRYLAVSAEAICRHSFGIRYSNALAIGFAVYFFYATLIQSLREVRSPYLDVYLVSYCLLFVYHILSMCWQRPQSIHSYSTGLPWSFWQPFHIKPMLLDLVVEPGCILLVGILLFPHDQALAIWLQLSAISLCVKRSMVRWNGWQHLLDVLDTRIEGERLNETVRERSAPRARTTAGHAPVSAGQPSAQNQPSAPQSLDGIFNNLDQGLRRLITTDNGQYSNPTTHTSSGQNSPNSATGGPLGHLPRIKSPRR